MGSEDLKKEAKRQWDEYVNTLRDAFTWAKDAEGKEYFGAIEKSDNELREWINKIHEETVALRNGIKRMRG